MQSIKQRKEAESKYEEFDEVRKFFKFLRRHSDRLKKMFQLASARLDTSESGVAMPRKKTKQNQNDITKEI